jgi:hypothetical protein
MRSTFNKNSQVFRIDATPSKSDHMKHTVGYCSTMELAKEKIGSGASYDSDDNCGWIYTITPCDITKIDRHVLSNLDHLPSYFPYTGW